MRWKKSEWMKVSRKGDIIRMKKLDEILRNNEWIDDVKLREKEGNVMRKRSDGNLVRKGMKEKNVKKKKGLRKINKRRCKIKGKEEEKKRDDRKCKNEFYEFDGINKVGKRMKKVWWWKVGDNKKNYNWGRMGMMKILKVGKRGLRRKKIVDDEGKLSEVGWIEIINDI